MFRYTLLIILALSLITIIFFTKYSSLKKNAIQKRTNYLCDSRSQCIHPNNQSAPKGVCQLGGKCS